MSKDFKIAYGVFCLNAVQDRQSKLWTINSVLSDISRHLDFNNVKPERDSILVDVGPVEIIMEFRRDVAALNKPSSYSATGKLFFDGRSLNADVLMDLSFEAGKWISTQHIQLSQLLIACPTAPGNYVKPLRFLVEGRKGERLATIESSVHLTVSA